MKVKAGKLLRLKEEKTLQTLLTCRDLPVTVAYDLAKFMRAIDEEAVALGTVRDNLLKKYLELDENGQPIVASTEGEKAFYQIKAGKAMEFHAEMDKLSAKDIEIPVDPPKVRLADIDKGLLSVSDFANLEGLVNFE